MSLALRVYRRTFFSAEAARTAILFLLEHSQWFEVTPLPDDEYEVAVKEENEQFLDNMATYQ